MAGATGPGALDEGRDRRRAALVALPWVLAAVLGLLGIASARDTPATPSTPATAAAVDPRPSAAATTTAGTDRDGPTAAAATGGSADPLPADAELAVLATARTAMGAPDRWPLDARVTTVEVVTAEYAVATVHGLVIEQRGGGWHGPEPQALAVLLRREPSPAVVGEAWPLPTPSLPVADPDLRSLEDPDASLVAPIQEAGWVVEEVTAVDATDDALLRVSLRGAPPGATEPTHHVLWLLDAPGGPRLLPLAAPTETTDPTDPTDPTETEDLQ